jgi:hypothetical protein
MNITKYQQYQPETQEKYNSFQSSIIERRGGGKGEPWVPPIYYKILYYNIHVKVETICVAVRLTGFRNHI